MKSKSLVTLARFTNAENSKKARKVTPFIWLIFTPTTLSLAGSRSGNSGGLVAGNGFEPLTSWV